LHFIFKTGSVLYCKFVFLNRNGEGLKNMEEEKLKVQLQPEAKTEQEQQQTVEGSVSPQEGEVASEGAVVSVAAAGSASASGGPSEDGLLDAMIDTVFAEQDREVAAADSASSASAVASEGSVVADAPAPAVSGLMADAVDRNDQGAALPHVAAVAPAAAGGGVSFSTLATGVCVVGAGAAAAAGAPVVAAAAGGGAVLGATCKLMSWMFSGASAPAAAPTGAANDVLPEISSGADSAASAQRPGASLG
jgi:hypothetical protein